jgi:ArsR family transcriptional regulator, arsenate/arsenite/antimonite-responsive transcriptional repressor
VNFNISYLLRILRSESDFLTLHSMSTEKRRSDKKEANSATFAVLIAASRRNH